MKIEIENYRGWEISFDTETETFYSLSQVHDTGQEKKSFSACKKYIDDFIKENGAFTPFYVEYFPFPHNGRKNIKIIGIRKDKKFIYEGGDGKKEQLSGWDERNYIQINPINDPFFERIQDLERRVQELRNEIKNINAEVVKKTLKDLKPNYII